MRRRPRLTQEECDDQQRAELALLTRKRDDAFQRQQRALGCAAMGALVSCAALVLTSLLCIHAYVGALLSKTEDTAGVCNRILGPKWGNYVVSGMMLVGVSTFLIGMVWMSVQDCCSEDPVVETDPVL